MRNIIAFSILILSILLTIFLLNRQQQLKKQQDQTVIPVDTTSTPTRSTPQKRNLSKAEIAKIKTLDKYADSITYQLIPTSTMEVSPGFHNEGSYFSGEFRSGATGLPLFAVKTYRDSAHHDVSRVNYILKNGKVVRSEESYFLKGKGLGVGQAFQYYDDKGQHIGTKNRHITFKGNSGEPDTVDVLFKVLDKSFSNPNELLSDLIDASFGRGGFALTFNGIIIDSANTYIRTRTFNDLWDADFIVNNQDKTFQRLSKDPNLYLGKVIIIEKGLGLDLEKGGRKNYYNGGTLVE